MIFNIFFIFGLLLGVRIAAFILKKREESLPPEPVFCKRHSWEKKMIDDTDPDMGHYLVCSVCRWLPESQGYEQ